MTSYDVPEFVNKIITDIVPLSPPWLTITSISRMIGVWEYLYETSEGQHGMNSFQLMYNMSVVAKDIDAQDVADMILDAAKQMQLPEEIMPIHSDTTLNDVEYAKIGTILKSYKLLIVGFVDIIPAIERRESEAIPSAMEYVNLAYQIQELMFSAIVGREEANKWATNKRETMKREVTDRLMSIISTSKELWPIVAL